MLFSLERRRFVRLVGGHLEAISMSSVLPARCYQRRLDTSGVRVFLFSRTERQHREHSYSLTCKPPARLLAWLKR